MEQTKQAIMDNLTANNGVVTYPALLETLGAEHRPQLYRALDTLKAEGKLKQQIRVVDGKPVHEVVKTE